MKRLFCFILTLALVFSVLWSLADDHVMSHNEFMQAALDTQVCVETYVQAAQKWWSNNGQGRMTLHLQSPDGAYYAFQVPMTEQESKKLKPGTKLRIKGRKDEWAGVIEITDAEYEILAGSWIAAPYDVTSLYGTDELIKHMNEKIAIKNARVAASHIEDQSGDYPFLYGWDGSGSHDSNSDLYFNLEINGQIYTVTVESNLTDNTTAVYSAVEGLKIGDTIDCEGFLYWYNYEPSPYITKVRSSGSSDPEEETAVTVAGGKYELDAKKKNAVFVGPEKKNARSLTIQDTVTIGKKSYKVTEVKSGACKGMTKLTTLTIGKNVKKIGAEAFSGCKKGKTVKILGTALKKIDKNAFSGWAKKVTVYAKKKALDKAVKLLVKAGMNGKITKKVLK